MGNPATKPGLLVVLVSGWRKRRVLLGGGRQEQKCSSLSLSLSLSPPPFRVTHRLEHLCCEVAFTVFSTTSSSFPLLYFPLSNSFTHSSSCSCCCFLVPSLLCHLYYSSYNLVSFPPTFLIQFISRLSLIVFIFFILFPFSPVFFFIRNPFSLFCSSFVSFLLYSSFNFTFSVLHYNFTFRFFIVLPFRLLFTTTATNAAAAANTTNAAAYILIIS